MTFLHMHTNMHEIASFKLALCNPIIGAEINWRRPKKRRNDQMKVIGGMFGENFQA